MLMEKKVSIIMPAFNCEKTIELSILSVIEQDYTNWELLIVDDNSSDNTLKIIKKYSNSDERIVLFERDVNKGAGFCRNIAISEATGRYIAFLDSDDLWRNNKLSKQIDFMEKKRCSLSYTWYRKIDEEGNDKGLIRAPLRVNYSELLKSNVIGCLTAIYDSEQLGKVYMPIIRKRQDMALWLKILSNIQYAWCLNEELAFYRERKNSLSSNKYKILFSQWNFYRNYLKLGLFKTSYYFFYYVCRALKKHRM